MNELKKSASQHECIRDNAVIELSTILLQAEIHSKTSIGAGRWLNGNMVTQRSEGHGFHTHTPYRVDSAFHSLAAILN